MGNFLKIIRELENELAKAKNVSEKFSDQMEYAIGHCKIALDSMRKLVREKGFTDRQSEIHFFKRLKPCVYSKLLYYQALSEIEKDRQKVDKERLRKYLNEELDKILDYMKENKIKVQYYRCNFEHLDEKYFTRNLDEIPLQVKDGHSILDEDFFTWHDHTFSRIKANDMLIEYLQAEIGKLDDLDVDNCLPSTNLKWTRSKTDLAEMVYALHFSDAVNNGNATIKQLSEVFQFIFNIELNDIYRIFPEIQQRKKEQIKFLNELITILKRRLDDLDQ